MKNTELPNWLRANSSGVYRPAAEAADYIEHLESKIARAQEALEHCPMDNPFEKIENAQKILSDK